MAHIGSVFLGDSTRQRVLSSSSSSSTPPSSPPPISPLPSSATQTTFGMAMNSPVASLHPVTAEVADEIDGVEEIEQETRTTNSIESASDDGAKSLPSFSYIRSLGQDLPPSIDPLTALELRLRLLESLVVGLDGEESRKVSSATLVKSTENIKRTVDKYVDGNETLKKFSIHYDRYAPYLTPAFALGLVDESALSATASSPESLQNYVHEMEPEIRSADTSMQEIENLLRRGVLDGGGVNDKLESYVPLNPRLSALIESHQQNQLRADELERRVARIMESHAGYIDTLSDLFLAWDDALIDAENRMMKMERTKEERERVGLTY
ncbi:hypothetical protein J3R30DRAFT_3509779 [Lentinula aciculospora]|uniref:Uncharacterized protein n=1 Tax=Lentinula aciculospora TaxID=153920 RepID=A0A9W9A3F5_9AGAR|nr:hypothetical protein J3R30DRAFT_3509779 [Lentinula aciculospora]